MYVCSFVCYIYIYIRIAQLRETKAGDKGEAGRKRTKQDKVEDRIIPKEKLKPMHELTQLFIEEIEEVSSAWIVNKPLRDLTLILVIFI